MGSADEKPITKPCIMYSVINTTKFDQSPFKFDFFVSDSWDVSNSSRRFSLFVTEFCIVCAHKTGSSMKFFSNAISGQKTKILLKTMYNTKHVWMELFFTLSFQIIL